MIIGLLMLLSEFFFRLLAQHADFCVCSVPAFLRTRSAVPVVSKGIKSLSRRAIQEHGNRRVIFEIRSGESGVFQLGAVIGFGSLHQLLRLLIGNLTVQNRLTIPIHRDISQQIPCGIQVPFVQRAHGGPIMMFTVNGAGSSRNQENQQQDSRNDKDEILFLQKFFHREHHLL